MNRLHESMSAVFKTVKVSLFLKDPFFPLQIICNMIIELSKKELPVQKYKNLFFISPTSLVLRNRFPFSEARCPTQRSVVLAVNTTVSSPVCDNLSNCKKQNKRTLNSGKFFVIFLSSAVFFKINFLENFFQEYH